MLWVILVVVIVAVVYLRSGPKGQWPDGPSGLPYFGTLPDKSIQLYEQLGKLIPQYGDFFSLKMGGSRMIVLGSPEAIDELVVKRGGKYASRPSVSPQAEIVGANRLVAMQYGDEFRKHRKLIHGLLGMQNSKIFLPYQEYESRQTLKHLLQDPGSFYREMARYSASVTFSLLIGARIDSASQKIPDALRGVALDIFSKMKPGYWLADRFPILNCLPDSLAPWRASAHKTFDNMIEFWSVFFDAIVRRMKTGDAPDCFLVRFLESPEVEHFSDNDRRVVLSELLGAGSETTATALQWFMKAVVEYPEFVRSAQEEIDQVVGPDRLPSYEDRPQLPYVAAVIEELHRWSSLVPIGVLHATSESDTYRGKLIPPRTTVVPHTYAVHHDNRYYRDPERFLPERFLSEKDPRFASGFAHAPMHYGFGVGRRECPGKYVADASLFFGISRLLWAFNIELGTHPKPEGLDGAYPVVRPKPFTCDITPRSPKVAEIILAEAPIKDPSLRVEDASQYEEEMLKVMARQGRAPPV